MGLPLSVLRTRHDRETVLGVLLALCGVALFTPVFAAARFSDVLVPALAIIWVRYISGAVCVAAVVVATRTRLSQLKSPQPHLHVIRVLFGATGGVCAIHAASVMPVADAAAIGLTEGLMIVALAALILRERVTFRHWLAGSLCALGAAIVLRAVVTGAGPGISGSEVGGDRSLEGAMAAFAGAFLIALETLIIKVVARRESALGVLANINAIAVVLFAVPGIMAVRAAELSWDALLPFLLLGPLAITAQFCNILAFRRADAAILGPVSYSWILFSALLGYVWFGELPGPGAAFGALLIVAGGIRLATLPASISVSPRVRSSER